MSDYIHYVHTCFQAAKRIMVTSHDINLLFTGNIQSQHQMSRIRFLSWWCHQMEAFSELLALCAGNSPMAGDFPSQRPVTRSFDVFCDLRLNKPLSKQSWAGDLSRHRDHYDVIVIFSMRTQVRFYAQRVISVNMYSTGIPIIKMGLTTALSLWSAHAAGKIDFISKRDPASYTPDNS